MTRTDGTSGCSRRQHPRGGGGLGAVAPPVHGGTHLKPCVWVTHARRGLGGQRITSPNAAAVRADDSRAPGHSSQRCPRCTAGTFRGGGTPGVLRVGRRALRGIPHTSAGPKSCRRGRGSRRGTVRGEFLHTHSCVPACARACAHAHATVPETIVGEGALSDPRFVRFARCHSRWRGSGRGPAGPVAVTLPSPCAQFLPVYRPSEAEKEDPALYANNVRRVMAE